MKRIKKIFLFIFVLCIFLSGCKNLTTTKKSTSNKVTTSVTLKTTKNDLITTKSKTTLSTSTSRNHSRVTTTAIKTAVDLAFETFCDELFIKILEGDPLSINFVLSNPESFGLEGEEVTPSTMSYIDYEEANALILELIDELKDFNYSELCFQNQIDYDAILFYFENTLYMPMEFYYYNVPLGSYLGYQAQLPSILAEYHFYTKNDIDNYMKYVSQAKESFESLVAFENEKVALGLSMPDFIINGVIEQCVNFYDTEEENYLIPVFNDKIDALDFLTAEEKVSYKEENKKIVNEQFVEAYRYLKVEMEKLLGKATKDGTNYGLGHTDTGKAYYAYLLKDAVGKDITPQEMISYIEEKIDLEYSTIMSYVRKNKFIYTELENLDLLNGREYEEALERVVSYIYNDFPKSSLELKYQISLVHESLQENSSPAYYFKSVIDANVLESIYVNPKDFEPLTTSSGTDLFSTLCHEGFPGHLYQHTYFKSFYETKNVRSAISYSGYSEGWAVYAENYVSKYLSTYEGISSSLLDFRRSNECLSYLIYARIDLGIGYEGWNVSDVYSYAKEYFSIGLDDAKAIFEQMVEIPTNFITYYYGYYQMVDLRNYAKKELKLLYDDYFFHCAILECGPAPWETVKKAVDKYISDTKGN